MKRATIIVFIIAIFLLINNESKAQCCPYINNVEIFPAYPTNNDSIILFTSISLPAYGYFLESFFTIDSMNLTFEACHYEGVYAVITDLDTSYNLGVFNAGEYNLNYIAYDSYNPYNCIRDDTNSMTIDFIVSDFIGIDESNELLEFEVYPNPVEKLLYIKPNSNIKIKRLEIIDLTGHTVLKCGYEEIIDCKELEKGTYILQIQTSNNIFTRKIVKIQN